MNNKEYRQWVGRFGRLVPVRMHSVGNESWARTAGLIGAVAVAMAVAQLTWRLVPPPVANGAMQPPARAGQSGSKPQFSISELTEVQLFGQPLAQPGGAITAPETTLNLTLRGIFALDSQRALAIIGSGGSDEQPYKVGGLLPGGAKVHEITPDKVILERGGRFETLTLPKQNLESGAEPAAGVQQSSARLGELRNRLRANPAEAVGLNAVQPVMENGQLKGYQLADNPYTPALRAAGMMPGDVVTKVNGIAVTDSARAAELVNQLSNAGHIDLEVERGGAITTLSVDLGK